MRKTKMYWAQFYACPLLFALSELPVLKKAKRPRESTLGRFKSYAQKRKSQAIKNARRERKERKQQGELLFDCPIVIEPHDDNDELIQLQAQYLLQGKKGAINKMYQILLLLAHKLIVQQAKKNKHIAHMTDAEIYEKAHDATVALLMRYKTDLHFFIKKSFVSQMYYNVLASLYHKKPGDNIVCVPLCENVLY